MFRIVLPALFLSSLAVLAFDTRVNKDAKRVADFEERVAAYVKLHNKAKADLPRLAVSESPEVVTQRERELADRIRALRHGAKQGEIFTPHINAEFRRLIGLSWHGSDGAHMKASMERAEPVHAPLHVNAAYPSSVPLQSTPPTLLQNLPALPKEVEYRVVGHRLVLRDTEADIVVDFTGGFIP